MSVVQACVAVQAAIARVRSLFGSAISVGVSDNSSTLIAEAVQIATAGRDRTVEMVGGLGMPSYRDMVDRSIPQLMTASTSDAGLTTQLVAAAAVTRAGADRLDAIAAQTRVIAQAAAVARTAAAQRAILTALRGQLQQASEVVQTTQQQGGAAATQIRALRYPKGAPGAGLGYGQHGPLPSDGPGDLWDPSTAYKLFNSLNECEAWITFRRVLYPWQRWECHLAGPGGVAGSFIVDQA